MILGEEDMEMLDNRVGEVEEFQDNILDAIEGIKNAKETIEFMGINQLHDLITKLNKIKDKLREFQKAGTKGIQEINNEFGEVRASSSTSE